MSHLLNTEKMTQEYGFDVLCDAVLNANPKIQSVAIINKQGRPIDRISRPGYQSSLPDKDNEMLFMQCVLQISMGRDFDEHFGPINYHLLERKDMTMITLPVRDHVIFVTADKNTSPISLAKKISSIIGENQEDSSGSYNMATV